MKLAVVNTQGGQRGAALIVALLISALVAVFAIRIANNYQLNVRRASNQILSDQATLYLLSAENIAKQLLMANADDGSEFDHNSEPWGATFPPVPIGNGLLAAEQLVDLQGRFNLNSLRQAPQRNQQPNQQGTNGDLDTPARNMFVRLLQTFDNLDIDLQTAEDIASAVIDWVDDNNSPTGFNGAEDSYYQDLDIPYRAANVPMRNVSELRLVKGVDARLFRLLEPHVTVLDESVQTININSASENVLRALASAGSTGTGVREPLDADELEAASVGNGADEEESTGQTREQFLDSSPWSELRGADTTQGRLAEGLIDSFSRYYALTSHAKLGELTLPMRTVFKVESSDKVLVLSRSTGSL